MWSLDPYAFWFFKNIRVAEKTMNWKPKMPQLQENSLLMVPSGLSHPLVPPLSKVSSLSSPSTKPGPPMAGQVCL